MNRDTQTTAFHKATLAWVLMLITQAGTWFVKTQVWMSSHYYAALAVLAVVSAGLAVWVVRMSSSRWAVPVVVLVFVVGQLWLFQWLFMQATFTR